MTRKKKCNSESNGFVVSVNVCLFVVASACVCVWCCSHGGGSGEASQAAVERGAAAQDPRLGGAGGPGGGGRSSPGGSSSHGAASDSTVASEPGGGTSAAAAAVPRKPRGMLVRGFPARSSNSSVREGLYHEYKKYGKVTSVHITGAGDDRHAVVSFRKSVPSLAGV